MTFGVSVPRLEDDPLLLGKARFVDDITFPDILECAFLRSEQAHALIYGIDVSAAESMPGVVKVLRIEDLEPYLKTTKMKVGLPSPSYRFEIDRPVLASTEVAHVGEPIAVVIATSRYAAEDALPMITVDYEALPAVVDCRAALEPDSPTAHSTLEHNLVADFTLEYGDADAAFAAAPMTLKETFWLHRGGSHSMECRGIVARYEPETSQLTLWNSSQTPNALRRLLADMLGMEEESIRVATPDVGGGFGPKLVSYPEEICVAIAAMMLKRPIKWIEDRREHFVSTTQERDQYYDAEIAFDQDGTVLGVRGVLIHDHGAYTARGTNVPYASALTVSLAYNVPAYRMIAKLALTNKVAVTPIRGAGQPQATFVMERLLDRMAQKLDLDRAEVRLRNLVRGDQMPCTKELLLRGGTKVILDSGDYPACQRTVMERADWRSFEGWRQRCQTQGKFVGIGIANYVEGTGRGPYEPVRVFVSTSGKIHISSSAAAMGQSTKTMLAQVVAEQLGRDMTNISVVVGDTAVMSSGFGGFNSRQAVMAGSSAHLASTKIRAKILEAAHHMLDVPLDQLDIIGTNVFVVGSNRSLSLAEISRALIGLPGFRLPGDLEPGLDTTENFIVHDMAFSNGSAVAKVEVDVETGHVTVTDFFLAHDCGKMINPMIVDGQVVGGIAHGISNTLFERMKFDSNGQPLTTNYGEYLLVTSTEMPIIDLVHRESPSPLNTLGIKGVGESGVIPVSAAVVSAIEHALSPFNVRLNQAPISPMDVLERMSEV